MTASELAAARRTLAGLQTELEVRTQGMQLGPQLLALNMDWAALHVAIQLLEREERRRTQLRVVSP